MGLRTIITCLLVLALGATSVARAPAAAPPRGEDSKIAPEEEREARELIEEFNRKFVETHDIDPLIEEYFVPDFSSRLRQNAETFPFIIVDWKDEAAPPDPEDLRRFYVASTNFLHDFFPLYAAAAKKCAEQEDGEDGGDESAKGDAGCNGDYDPEPKKFLPPAAVEIIEADPLLRGMWLGSDASDAAPDGAAAVQATPQSAGGASGECAGGCAASAEHKAGLVENAAELRHVTKLFDDLGKTLRAHLAAHPVSFEKEAADEDEDEESKEAEFRRFDPKRVSVSRQARVLSKEFYGYPEGTRLVCAGVGALHAELVRVDGRLRILTIYSLTEG
jgi:hypothetical protein